MKRPLLIALLLSAVITTAQELLPNGSFENNLVITNYKYAYKKGIKPYCLSNIYSAIFYLSFTTQNEDFYSLFSNILEEYKGKRNYIIGKIQLLKLKDNPLLKNKDVSIIQLDPTIL